MADLPKTCTCCGTIHDAAAWYDLSYVGDQMLDADEHGPAIDLELRNCGCGSTIAIDRAMVTS